jgi:hypothetical protein
VRFNKLLYIEKEGFLEALKHERWPEKHDCAVLSSKGFSTRAARDLIDLLAAHDEPIAVFCVHDADAHGTMIYQTLQEATKARGARKIDIINFGLEPWEAIDMGLEVEDIGEKDKRRPVADYVPDDWANWLQEHRVELNAMTTPQFIEWLDSKMAEHGDGKLIPPPEVVEAELEAKIEEDLREAISERILQEADFEGQVAQALAEIERPSDAAMVTAIRLRLKLAPEEEWREYIRVKAAELSATYDS